MRDCNSPFPPTDIDAEQRLLGAILNCAPIPAGLRGEHFADPIHAKIFAAVDVAAWDGGLPFPAGTVDTFNRTGALHDVGGTPYLKQLLAMGRCDAATAADAIRDAWARRQLIGLAETIATEAFAGRLNSEEIRALAQGRLNALASDAAGAPVALAPRQMPVVTGFRRLRDRRRELLAAWWTWLRAADASP
jgi:replicative DNA helicase